MHSAPGISIGDFGILKVIWQFYPLSAPFLYKNTKSIREPSILRRSLMPFISYCFSAFSVIYEYTFWSSWVRRPPGSCTGTPSRTVCRNRCDPQSNKPVKSPLLSDHPPPYEASALQSPCSDSLFLCTLRKYSVSDTPIPQTKTAIPP